MLAWEVSDIAFRRYHCNMWAASGQHWLPIGAWAKCADPTVKIHPGERVFVGVDVGGERSASAVVWATEDLRVDCKVFHGDRAVLECAEQVRGLAETYNVAEVSCDPWRFEGPALERGARDRCRRVPAESCPDGA